MGSAYEDIISSDVFAFIIGPNAKKYSVHGAVISRLSKPLNVLINGDMCEAKEKHIKWPEIDEKTFVRFTQWAYTETYVTEEPEILLGHSPIGTPDFPSTTPIWPEGDTSETPLYSLLTLKYPQFSEKECCWNAGCGQYGTSHPVSNHRATCLVCRNSYNTSACASCKSVYSDCPTCGPLTRVARSSCSNGNCNQGYYRTNYGTRTSTETCLRCRTHYSTTSCYCGSTFNDCAACAVELARPVFSKRSGLVREFLDASGTTYPTSASIFSPRRNTESYEDYTAVFLCHARLYVMADTYDIPALKELSLHRLHATLKIFTLYPSRFNDIATLAKYVFENTVPDDKIRDMVTLYYACIVEDTREYDGLKSLIDEIPDFAFGLISKMGGRLA